MNNDLWLIIFLSKLAHFFISAVAQFFIDKGNSAGSDLTKHR